MTETKGNVVESVEASCKPAEMQYATRNYSILHTDFAMPYTVTISQLYYTLLLFDAPTPT